MYKFRINISRLVASSYRHHFTVELEHSVADPANVRRVLRDLTERFPAPAYNVTIARQSVLWQTVHGDCYLKAADAAGDSHPVL